MGEVVHLCNIKHVATDTRTAGERLAYRTYNLAFIASNAAYRRRLKQTKSLTNIRALLANAIYRVLWLKRRNVQEYQRFIETFSVLERRLKISGDVA